MISRRRPKDIGLVEFIRNRIIPIYGEYRKFFEKHPSYLKAAIDGAKASGLSLTGPVGSFIQAFEGSIKNEERDKRIMLVKKFTELSSQEIQKLAQLLELHSHDIEQLKEFYTLDEKTQNVILLELNKIQESLAGLEERMEEGHEEILSEISNTKVKEEKQPITITDSTVTINIHNYQSGMANQTLGKDTQMQNKKPLDKIEHLSKWIQEKRTENEISKFYLQGQNPRIVFHALLHAGDIAFEAKDFKVAESIFNVALSYAKKIPDEHLLAVGLLEVGAALGSQGSHAEALGYFNQALSFDANLSNGYYNRGNVYYSRKDYPKAIADYTRVIEIDPRNAAAYYNRGLAYYKLKDYPKAIAGYTRVIEIDPRNAAAYNNRGLAYYRLKDYPKAIADYTRVIEIDLEYAAAYNNRGLAYYKLKDYPKAIADYTRVIEIDPRNAAAYNNRGNVYYRLKDYPKAIADYSRSIEIDPEYAAVYYNRGSAYYKLKHYPKAIADYTRVIEIDPRDALAIANLGGCYLRMKNRAKGIHFLEQALKLKAKLPDKGTSIAECLKNLNRRG